MTEVIARAAEALRHAQALLVTAGAGMGVDSGLPDFRGNEGFWRAYPPYARLGYGFSQLANPRWFRDDPGLAWGFYGHRLELYRATVPHEGFARLRRWGERMAGGTFVFTSNVDGQFQKAGFDPERITECHGSIHHAQCLRGCGVGIFPADAFSVQIDPETFRASEPLPTCSRCGAMARPNILMFGDGDWDEARTEQQHGRIERWLQGLDRTTRLLVVECGAGTAIPSVRRFGEQCLAAFPAARLLRLNVRESQVEDARSIGLAMGARAALEAIESGG